ncbi:hypothetical protein BKA66DRAFT_515869 [Pyrenochaeta sp. MPI-SDFR-AT-0127]|nr:hypothetical protein BKA66DRAFT_515869 [Pyrenochaeta sp. MPI-SDFR-AT-0127]
MSLEAPPPSRHIASRPISLTCASRMLESYLKNSERHPHLHPDALITPTGVTFSSHGGPTGGVVMHNLRRVAAGLQGQYLEPEGTPEPEDGEGDNSEELGHGKKVGKRVSRDIKGGKASADQDGWQNKAEYERDYVAVEISEIGDRKHVARDGSGEPEIEVTGGPQVSGTKRKKGTLDGQHGQDGPKLDKQARKKAKKERNKQQRREQEKKRAEMAE